MRTILTNSLTLAALICAFEVQIAQAAPLSELQARTGLPNFLQKLETGGPVHIAYLGGSITAQEGWRPKTLQWFREQFPSAKLTEINAAIGGTGSDLGVFRLKRDVLDHDPDLLFVEFAVNDSGAAPAQIHRCMEGIVRQTWKHNAKTDICFVYTLAGTMLDTLKEEQLPRSIVAMEQIADHYGIPTINMGLPVARLEKAGKLVFKGDLPKDKSGTAGEPVVFSPDAVHPYPETGHQIYLEAVVRSFEALRKMGQPQSHSLPEPFVADQWEAATMVPHNRAKLSSGWQRLDPATANLARQFKDRLPELWRASQPGESISFRFRGRTAKIYDLLGPDCGQVIVKIDDRPPEVKARFDAYCTYHRLATLTIADELPDGIHQVEVTVHPEQPDKAKILSQRHQTIDDPKRYDGTNWYAGSLLLVGELVE